MVFSTIKFSQKGDYYQSLIICGVDENTSSNNQLSYKLEKQNCKVSYLNWKGNTKNKRKKVSRTYHLVMSIFRLFHFFACMKIWLDQDVSMRDHLLWLS